jgi:hypothetical protein
MKSQFITEAVTTGFGAIPTAQLAGGLAAKGAAAMGLGGAGTAMAAGLLLNPVSLLAGTALAASGVAIGERAIGDLRAAHEMQNILTVRGSSVDAARDISRQLVQTGRSAAAFTGVETEALFEMGLAGGLFNRQMGDPQQLVGRLGKVARSAKELMRSLNLSMREAMQHITEMNQSGVEVEDITAATMQNSAFARAAGVRQGAMASASAMGARLATSMGIRGFAGAGVAQSAMVTSSIAATEMDSALMRAAGGVQGSAQAIAARTIAFAQSGLGQAIIMGNMGNMPGMAGGIAGQGGIAGSVLQAAQAVAAGGPMGGMKATFAMQEARAKMDDVDLENLARGTIMGIARTMPGIDPKDQEMMAALSASVMGFDMNTAEGAQQARIFAKGFDPSVQMRKSLELREQRRRVLTRSGLASSQGEAMVENLRENTWGKWGNAVAGMFGEAEGSAARFGRRFRSERLAPIMGRDTMIGKGLAQASALLQLTGIEFGRETLDSLSMLGSKALTTTTYTAGAEIERRALEAIADARGPDVTAEDVLRERTRNTSRIGRDISRARFMKGLFAGGMRRIEEGDEEFTGSVESMMGLIESGKVDISDMTQEEQIKALLKESGIAVNRENMEAAAAALSSTGRSAEASLTEEKIGESARKTFLSLEKTGESQVSAFVARAKAGKIGGKAGMAVASAFEEIDDPAKKTLVATTFAAMLKGGPSVKHSQELKRIFGEEEGGKLTRMLSEARSADSGQKEDILRNLDSIMSTSDKMKDVLRGVNFGQLEGGAEAWRDAVEAMRAPPLERMRLQRERLRPSKERLEPSTPLRRGRRKL